MKPCFSILKSSMVTVGIPFLSVVKLAGTRVFEEFSSYLQPALESPLMICSSALRSRPLHSLGLQDQGFGHP